MLKSFVDTNFGDLARHRSITTVDGGMMKAWTSTAGPTALWTETVPASARAGRGPSAGPFEQDALTIGAGVRGCA